MEFYEKLESKVGDPPDGVMFGFETTASTSEIRPLVVAGPTFRAFIPANRLVSIAVRALLEIAEAAIAKAINDFFIDINVPYGSMSCKNRDSPP